MTVGLDAVALGSNMPFGVVITRIVALGIGLTTMTACELTPLGRPVPPTAVPIAYGVPPPAIPELRTYADRDGTISETTLLDRLRNLGPKFQVIVGEQFVLRLPAWPRYRPWELHVSDPRALTPAVLPSTSEGGDTLWTFRAAVAGSTDLAAEATPDCSPTDDCPFQPHVMHMTIVAVPDPGPPPYLLARPRPFSQLPEDRTLRAEDKDKSFELAVGEVVYVDLRALRESTKWGLATADPRVLEPVDAPLKTLLDDETFGAFRALGRGQTYIRAGSLPICPPGIACPAMAHTLEFRVLVRPVPGAKTPTASPTRPLPLERPIGVDDDGATFRADVGDELYLVLRTPAHFKDWRFVDPDANVLGEELAFNALATHDHGTRAVFRATGPGQAIVEATAEPDCTPGQTCPTSPAAFSVTIVVLTAPTRIGLS